MDFDDVYVFQTRYKIYGDFQEIEGWNIYSLFKRILDIYLGFIVTADTIKFNDNF